MTTVVAATPVTESPRAAMKAELKTLTARLRTLCRAMNAAHTHALLVVLSGMDAAGKDGVISHVLGTIEPQYCTVTPFKAPTEDEALHDFLWKAHGAAPARGQVAIFNRSYYDGVLFQLAHGLVTWPEAEPRCAHIVAFERLLAETNRTIIVKIYLELSQEEQTRRIDARSASRKWKLSHGDLRERAFWDGYMDAYGRVCNRTGAQMGGAGWQVIDADDKLAARVEIARRLVQRLEREEGGWLRHLRQHNRGF